MRRLHAEKQRWRKMFRNRVGGTSFAELVRIGRVFPETGRCEVGDFTELGGQNHLIHSLDLLRSVSRGELPVFSSNCRW